jgi:hypothetical protein
VLFPALFRGELLRTAQLPIGKYSRAATLSKR